MTTFLLITWVIGCFWSVSWRNQTDSMVFAMAPFWPVELGLFVTVQYLLIPLLSKFERPRDTDVDPEWVVSMDRDQKTEG